MSSRVVGTLLRDALGQPQKQIVYGEVSLSQPAPASFSAPLYVTIPDWSTDFYHTVQPGNWFACHGSTLPQAGAHCLLIYDNQGTLTCPLWASATTAFSATSINGTTVPLTGSAWVTPTLLNSWAGSFQYVKDPLGFVHLRGNGGTGASATTAFTLPAGFRPGITDFWPALQSAGAAGSFLRIATDGTVAPTYTGAAVYVNGITFLAEN